MNLNLSNILGKPVKRIKRQPKSYCFAFVSESGEKYVTSEALPPSSEGQWVWVVSGMDKLFEQELGKHDPVSGWSWAGEATLLPFEIEEE